MNTPSPWPMFYMEELTCKCGCGRMEMDDETMWEFVRMRRLYNSPWNVTSGYRCPDYNDQVSSTGRNGPHTTGKALDIEVSNSGRRYRLLETVMSQGIKRIGVGNNFLHIDKLTPADGFVEGVVWTY